MQEFVIRVARQPKVAMVTGGAALGGLLSAYTSGHGSITGPDDLAIGCVLLVAVVLSYQFPVYIRHNTKICLTSIPLFLMAVLLSPAIAATGAGLSILVGELTVRAQRGAQIPDIATHAARWVLIMLAGSALGNMQTPAGSPTMQVLPLLAVGAVLWAGDLLTLPLALVPISGEPPVRIVLQVVREGGPVELMQYAVGIAGALVATYQVWTVVVLAIPAVLIYLAFSKEMDEETMQLLESMADSVDLRDPYTAGHSRRVADLAGGVLRELGMHGQEARLIKRAARIHDLGKIDLPDQVLIKPGALTPEEDLLVKCYPDRSAQLLAQYPDFSRGVEMVRYHHERWDGRGYPFGLKGTEIPFGARLIAVVDSFDAMTSARPYRRALPVERAAQILRDGRGRQWDPNIVAAFLRSTGQPVNRSDHEGAPAGDYMKSARHELPVAGQRVPA